MNELIQGTIIDHIICESFQDKSAGRIRVRPIAGQNLPLDLKIECSKEERIKHPLGTRFNAYDLRVCRDKSGRLYLRAENQMIYKI